MDIDPVVQRKKVQKQVYKVKGGVATKTTTSAIVKAVIARKKVESEAPAPAPGKKGLPTRKACRKILRKTWPALFKGKDTPLLPLKVGITKDMAARPECPKRMIVRKGLCGYVTSKRYLEAIAKGGPRYDLDGQPCGEIEQIHIDHAKRTLEEMAQEAKKKSDK